MYAQISSNNPESLALAPDLWRLAHAKGDTQLADLYATIHDLMLEAELVEKQHEAALEKKYEEVKLEILGVDTVQELSQRDKLIDNQRQLIEGLKKELRGVMDFLQSPDSRTIPARSQYAKKVRDTLIRSY